jgi:threonine/homoserine efflux transporter RhtA
MGCRALTVVLVVCAVVSDSLGAHELAFYALLSAVPFAAVSALVLVGDLVESLLHERADTLVQLQTLFSTLMLALLLTGAAARSAALAEGGVPALAASALVACLVLLGAESLIAAFLELRRRRVIGGGTAFARDG